MSVVEPASLVAEDFCVLFHNIHASPKEEDDNAPLLLVEGRQAMPGHCKGRREDSKGSVSGKDRFRVRCVALRAQGSIGERKGSMSCGECPWPFCRRKAGDAWPLKGEMWGEKEGSMSFKGRLGI